MEGAAAGFRQGEFRGDERRGEFEAVQRAVDMDAGGGGEGDGGGDDGVVLAVAGIIAERALFSESGIVGDDRAAALAGELERGGEAVDAGQARGAAGDQPELAAGGDGDGGSETGRRGLGELDHAFED